MKRKIYIFLFIIFGLMAAFFGHIIFEILYINLLTQNFDRWSLGLSWQTWFLVHKIGTFILEIIGLVFGIYFGRRFANYFKY